LAGQLITKSFISECLAFPSRIDGILASTETPGEVKGFLDKATAMRVYAENLRAGIEVERPIALGVLKIKARLGELLPAKSPGERGQGRGGNKSSEAASLDLSNHTLSAYRKLAKHKGKIEEYYEATEDVPTQTDFIRYVGSDGNLKSNQNKGLIEWYTPRVYIDAARKAMKSIDIDPASNDKSQEIVKAKVYYTKENSGLDHEWKGNVFMNPPFKADLIKAFVAKLTDSFSAGITKQAILLTNNNTDTQWWHKSLELASVVCFTKGRVAFYSPLGETAQPTNGHTFFYMGNRPASFAKEFTKFGSLMEKWGKQ
jgi:hypothetical protein